MFSICPPQFFDRGNLCKEKIFIQGIGNVFVFFRLLGLEPADKRLCRENVFNFEQKLGRGYLEGF